MSLSTANMSGTVSFKIFKNQFSDEGEYGEDLNQTRMGCMWHLIANLNHHKDQCCSSRGNLVPRKTLGNAWRHVLVTTTAADNSYVKTKEAS